MRAKTALAMTTAALLLSGTALAQQSPPAARDVPPPAPSATMPSDRSTASLPASSLHELKGDSAAMTVPGLNVSAKDLDGMDIYGTDGKKIGDVDKVLADNSNVIKAVTIDVGGFLGIGAREVVLPIERLQPGTEKDRLQTAMTKQDLEKLDKWENPDRNMRGDTPTQGRTPSPAPAPTR